MPSARPLPRPLTEDAAVPPTYPLPELIARRSSERRLTRMQLLTRMGYTNVTKGLRRLAAIEQGELRHAGQFHGPLAAALGIPPEVVEDASAATRAALDVALPCGATRLTGRFVTESQGRCRESESRVTFSCIFRMITGSPSDRSPPSPSMPAHRCKPAPSVRDHPMMNKTFEIDGIAYEVTYEDHRFLFAIDPARSTACMAGYDSFGACHDDCPDPIPAPTTPPTKTRSILKVKREVMTFIDQVLHEYKPYYFTFAATEHGKIGLYRRVAERIARTHGVTLYVSPEHVPRGSIRFSFYYQVAIRGETDPRLP
jgi:hypothetical protein